MKKFAIIAVLSAGLVFGACDKKKEGEGKEGEEGGGKAKAPAFNCEAIAKKNEKCSDAIIEVASEMQKERMKKQLEKMPEAARKAAEAKMDEQVKKAAAMIKEAMTGDKFMAQCKKAMEAEKETEAQKEAKTKFKKCFEKEDCKEYAKCLMTSM